MPQYSVADGAMTAITNEQCTVMPNLDPPKLGPMGPNLVAVLGPMGPNST